MQHAHQQHKTKYHLIHKTTHMSAWPNRKLSMKSSWYFFHASIENKKCMKTTSHDNKFNLIFFSTQKGIVLLSLWKSWDISTPELRKLLVLKLRFEDYIIDAIWFFNPQQAILLAGQNAKMVLLSDLQNWILWAVESGLNVWQRDKMWFKHDLFSSHKLIGYSYKCT